MGHRKTSRRAFIVVGLLAALLAGCEGERLTSAIEEGTSEGRWRPEGVLIRSYNVTRDQAADAILALARDKRWLVLSDKRGERTADINVKTNELVEIEFDVWAPANAATDIGIEYAGGNRPGSIRVFEDLERLLPGKRIIVNQPQ